MRLNRAGLAAIVLLGGASSVAVVHGRAQEVDGLAVTRPSTKLATPPLHGNALNPLWNCSAINIGEHEVEVTIRVYVASPAEVAQTFRVGTVAQTLTRRGVMRAAFSAPDTLHDRGNLYGYCEVSFAGNRQDVHAALAALNGVSEVVVEAR